MVLIDMYEGIGWGGSELWAANLAEMMSFAGKKVMLIGDVNQPRLENRYENIVTRISDDDTIMHMVHLMEDNLPCVFINNFAGCAFMAAVIVKRRHPGLVKIISVIHNDNKALFDAHMMLDKYIDKVFCVSDQIRRHMIEIYDFDINKYYYKEQPIDVEHFGRKIRDCGKPIRIGYAARLVRQQKRADLLVDLISCLEDKNMDYLFQIAGDGECLEMIRDFISLQHLEDKVQLMGRLPKGDMDGFWMGQDIFVNISEYEGTSLSMLESMASGCVPVVTDVSGAREFITDGENGYICKIGDLESIADRIKLLSHDAGRLYDWGKKCMMIVADRCNPHEYLNYWNKYLL
jgi:glycosyltransferase involved in cell wall biosynthesis